MTDAAELPEPEPIADDETSPVEAIAVEHDESARVLDDEELTSEHGAAVVPFERPTVPLVPGHDIPIIPGHEEMRGLAAMAVTLAGASAVPKPLQNKPNDVFQVLLSARDLGVAVTTAMREFHVIDGRVTLSPKVKLAMVNERGAREGWAVWPCAPDQRLDPPRCPHCGNTDGNTAEHATWHATRRDRPGILFTSPYTWDMAKGAGMVSWACFPREHAEAAKCKCKTNWKGYPERMVSWRALGYLLDDVFPEVATGIYSPDELGAMTDPDGNVIDVQSTEPLPGTSAPRGHMQPPEPTAAESAEHAEKFAALVARVEAIKACPSAAGVMRELWAERELLPLPRMTVRQLGRAVALVESIEKRLKADEWGADERETWQKLTSETHEHAAATTAAETTTTAEDAPSGSESVTASVDDETVTCARCEQQIEWDSSDWRADGGTVCHTTDGDAAHAPPLTWCVQLSERIVAEVKGMKPTDVTTALAERVGDVKGNMQAQRLLLAELIYRDRGGVMPDEPPETAIAGGDEPTQPTLDQS